MTFDPSPRVELRVLDPRLGQWGLPERQSEQAAAVDLRACLDAPLDLAAGAPPELIPSGIAIHMNDPGLAALILPRSGLGHKRGLVLGNLLGLVDADYMAEIMISAWNRNPPGGAAVRIEPGERIAQMLFVPVVRPVLARVEHFSRTSGRGEGGFGSTGS